jgi:hypothetical protein
MIVLQMEIPFETVTKVVDLASKHKTPLLLNVAPAREIPVDILKEIGILVVNETEIERVSGKSIASLGEEGVIDILLSKGVHTVILTLGKKGCIVKSNSLTRSIAAFEVDAVDTTAKPADLSLQTSNKQTRVTSPAHSSAASFSTPRIFCCPPRLLLPVCRWHSRLVSV